MIQSILNVNELRTTSVCLTLLSSDAVFVCHGLHDDMVPEARIESHLADIEAWNEQCGESHLDGSKFSPIIIYYIIHNKLLGHAEKADVWKITTIVFSRNIIEERSTVIH